MKTIIQITFLFGLMISGLNAQIRTPPLSQKQKIEQKVGFTNVTIEYCRPSMRGRQIFGDLVKYGEVWRTGANRNTLVSFSESVSIGDTQMESGTYTLFTLPNESKWQIYFYPYDNGYGVPEDFSPEKSKASLELSATKTSHTVENLTINLDDVTENTANLTVMWENTLVTIPMLFTTEGKIMADIDELVNSHSSDYYMAALYYLDNGKDLEKAKMFIQKAIDLREEPNGVPKFWIYQKQGEILFAAKELENALVSAKKALDMATSRGEDDFYVKQIRELINQISKN